jgi:hypothetical protein
MVLCRLFNPSCHYDADPSFRKLLVGVYIFGKYSAAPLCGGGISAARIGGRGNVKKENYKKEKEVEEKEKIDTKLKENLSQKGF